MLLYKEGQELAGILQGSLIFRHEANQLRHQLFRELLLLRFARGMPPPASVALTIFTLVASTSITVRQAAFRTIFF